MKTGRPITKGELAKGALALAALALAQAVAQAQGAGGKKLIVKETPVARLQPEPAHAMTTQADYLPWGLHLSWSPDMKRVVYWATGRKGMFLVADGVAGRPFDILDDGSPRGGLEPPDVFFSPDSRRFAYAARRGRKWFLVLDGKEGKPYDGVRDFRFSPDSKRWAFVARRGPKYLVVRGGTGVAPSEGKPYPWIAGNDLHFSPDSKRLAYWAQRGRRNLIVLHEGAKVTETDFDPRKRRSLLSQTAAPRPNRGEVKTITREGKEILVINGVESPPYDYTAQVAFSADAEHFAFYAWRAEKLLVVVDGAEFEGGYEGSVASPLPPLVSDGPRSWHTLARRGDQVLRLEIEAADAAGE